MVEWIVGVGLVKEVDEAVDDGVDVEDGLPVLPEDVEADLTLEVDVGVVDARFAVDLGRGVGVMVGDLESEEVGGTLPEAGVGSDGDVEGAEVVRVGEFDLGDLASVELGNVCKRVGRVARRSFVVLWSSEQGCSKYERGVWLT